MKKSRSEKNTSNAFANPQEEATSSNKKLTISDFLKRLVKASKEEFLFIIGTTTLGITWYIQTVEISKLTQADSSYKDAIENWNFATYQAESMHERIENHQFNIEKFPYKGTKRDTLYWTTQAKQMSSLINLQLGQKRNLIRILEEDENTHKLITVEMQKHNNNLLRIYDEAAEKIKEEPALTIELFQKLVSYSNIISKEIEEQQADIHAIGDRRIHIIRDKKDRLDKWVLGLLIIGTILLTLDKIIKYLVKEKRRNS